MGTAIILLILFMIVIYALKGTLKHMSGQGDCCGGSRDPIPKKKRKGGGIGAIGRKS